MQTTKVLPVYFWRVRCRYFSPSLSRNLNICLVTRPIFGNFETKKSCTRLELAAGMLQIVPLWWTSACRLSWGDFLFNSRPMALMGASRIGLRLTGYNAKISSPWHRAKVAKFPVWRVSILSSPRPMVLTSPRNIADSPNTSRSRRPTVSCTQKHAHGTINSSPV